MNSEELQKLILQDEGIKLDFKREYKLNKTPPDGTDKQRWIMFIEGQWHEFIKDIIALTNGNVGTADQVGRLIIGVDDELLPDGTRNLYDTSHLQITTRQIIAKVNSACEPPIPDIDCERIVLDRKSICVISIPPSPHVHETNRQLEITKGDFNQAGQLVNVKKEIYTKYTAFIRIGENVSPASSRDRRALESDKRFELIALNDNIKFELLHNLKYLLRKGEQGVFSSSSFFRDFRENVALELGKSLEVKEKHIRQFMMGLIHACNGTHQNLSTQFIDYAIQSGKYLRFNLTKNTYERSLFLDYLHDLQINVRRFESLSRDFQLVEFLGKYKSEDYSYGKHITIRCDDFFLAYALLARHEDIINISVALLAYLMGDETRLEPVKLNSTSPYSGEAVRMKEETPSDTEIMNWIFNKQNS